MNNPPSGTGDGPSSSTGEPAAENETQRETSPAAAWPPPSADTGSSDSGAPSLPPADYVRPPSRLGLVWRGFVGFPVTKIVVFFAASLILAIPLGIPIVFRFFFNKPLLLFYGEIDQLLATILAMWLMARFIDRRPLSSFGFGGGGAFIRETAIGFLIGAGIMSLVFAALVGGGWCRLSPTVLTTAGHHVLARYVLFYLAVALYEEITFRGYFFQTLEGRWGTGAGLAATMLIFGLLHIFNEGLQPTRSALIGGFFIAAEAGLLLAAAYLLTRRLWLPIGIHWAWNLFQGQVYGADVSGIGLGPSIYRAYFHGPALVTGGAFGPEAGLPALIVGTITGLVLLRMAVRRGHWISLADIQARKTTAAIPY